MKKYFFLIIAVILIAAGCGVVKQYPMSALEMSGTGPDTTTYPFESTNPFTLDMANDRSFTSASISSDRSFFGTNSLKIYASYTGLTGYRSGLLQREYAYGSYADMRGLTLTARIWLPREAFASAPDYSYGANFFMLTSDESADPTYHWLWYQSDWVNLTLAPAGVDGVWTEISVPVDDMISPDKGNETAAATGVHSSIYKWGVKVAMGDDSPPFTGYIYIDSINVE